MTTFTLKIKTTDVTDRVETLDEDLNATVTATISKIHWELEGVDGDKTVSHFGVVDVDLKNVVPSEVTEETLMQALTAALSEETINAEKAKIEEQLNPSEE
jgi:hypothetical protein